MSRKKRDSRGTILVCVALMLGLAGCYEHTFNVGRGAPYAPIVEDDWQTFWLAGLVGHYRLDVEEMCPSGDATIEAKQTFLNGLVAALTSGIYTPTTVRVRCRTGRRADFDLSERDVATLVGDPAFLDWVGHEMPERLDEVTSAVAALDP
jgi:hypothetical protein